MVIFPRRVGALLACQSTYGSQYDDKAHTQRDFFRFFFFFSKSCRAHVRGFSADSKRDILRNVFVFFFFFFFFLKNKPLIRGSAMEGTEEEKKQCKKHQVYMRACLHVPK